MGCSLGASPVPSQWCTRLVTEEHRGRTFMIRVLLVDDHPTVRDPLGFMLDYQDDMEVIGLAGSLAEAREMMKDPDIVLLDLDLPDGRGTELIADIRAARPDSGIIILSGTATDLDHALAIEAGADGLLRKTARIPEILEAIRRLAAGASIHKPDELMRLLQIAAQQRERDRQIQRTLGAITNREQEILQALAEGLSDKEIAERHSVSVRTVQTQMTRLLDKLGVESRLQALVVSLRHGAITINE